MPTHLIIPTFALVRRGSAKQGSARSRDLHRTDCNSDLPAVILATLPTFPKNQTTWATYTVWEGSPRPRAVDGKGKPQTRGVRANAAVTLMLLANLMPLEYSTHTLSIAWGCDRMEREQKKKMKQTSQGVGSRSQPIPLGTSTPRLTSLF